MSETPAPPEEPLDRIATALRDAFCLGVKDQALVLIDKVNAQLPAARAELAALRAELEAVKGEHKESQGANRYLLNEATALRARLAAAERMAEAAERLPWSEQNPDFSTALAAFRDLT